MGGGTTLVEALAHGRRSVGVDLNPLATFVTTVKTTPLSDRDARTIFRWLERIPIVDSIRAAQEAILIDPRAKNLPPTIAYMFDYLLHRVDELPYPRQRRFVQCALLRLG